MFECRFKGNPVCPQSTNALALAFKYDDAVRAHVAANPETNGHRWPLNFMSSTDDPAKFKPVRVKTYPEPQFTEMVNSTKALAKQMQFPDDFDFSWLEGAKRPEKQT